MDQTAELLARALAATVHCAVSSGAGISDLDSAREFKRDLAALCSLDPALQERACQAIGLRALSALSDQARTALAIECMKLPAATRIDLAVGGLKTNLDRDASRRGAFTANPAEGDSTSPAL